MVDYGSMPLSDKRESWFLFVQDNTQEGFVDVDLLVVVLDEATELKLEKLTERTNGYSCFNCFV